MSPYQFKSQDDTIAAVSTAVGQGGIGIVRFSGPEALSVVDKIFRLKSGVRPSEVDSHTVHYGKIIDGDETVDEALLTVMRAPKSYTRQDVVEISCHGGAASLKAILGLATANGVRPAEPGEFTKRAFLNGRIDLVQAEAVLDIIRSRTETFLRVSAHQLEGNLSRELAKIRDMLMEAYVSIEAIVNFPEDEIEEAALQDLRRDFEDCESRVVRLLETADHGRILKDGLKIVLCGKPNAGKSSLLNVLLREPRAIVSDIAGTTRDTIEEPAQIGGIPFQLVDTAGMIEPRDLIEEEAVRRSHDAINAADLVLLIIDTSVPISAQDEEFIRSVQGRNVLVVLNKMDLPLAIDETILRDIFPGNGFVRVCALDKITVHALETKIMERVWQDTAVDTHGVMISNLRHVTALQDTRQCLRKIPELLDDGVSPEFISEEVKSAVNSLDSITGRNIDTDLLDTIFSQFCIGK